MGSYALNEVIRRWERGTLTTEQTIGQILLLMEQLSQRVGALEQRMEVERNGKKAGPGRRKKRPPEDRL